MATVDSGSTPNDGSADNSGRRALVVEDNPLLAMQVKIMLEECGVASVTTASTVEQALCAVASDHFDFAVLDINLGGENGLIVAERCSEKRIAIIFSTGYSELILPVAFAHEQVLAKPYLLHDLEQAILKTAPRRKLRF